MSSASSLSRPGRGGGGGYSGQKPLPQSCHPREPVGGGGEAEPGLAGAGGREASRAAGWPEKWVQPGAGTMPLQDDTLREVWASERSGKPPLHTRSNCQHLLDHQKSKRVPEKHLLLLY